MDIEVCNILEVLKRDKLNSINLQLKQSLNNKLYFSLEELPNKPGIYFLKDSDKVLYIGISSISIKNRWRSHHKKGFVLGMLYALSLYNLNINSLTLSWHVLENIKSKSHLLNIENYLINLFKPALNIKRLYNKKDEAFNNKSLQQEIRNKVVGIEKNDRQSKQEQYQKQSKGNKKRGRPLGSKNKNHASGYIGPATQLKNGIRYPQVQGNRIAKERAIEKPEHYLWFYNWSTKDKDGKWRSKSKYVKTSKVLIVKQMINNKLSVNEILDYIVSN